MSTVAKTGPRSKNQTMETNSAQQNELRRASKRGGRKSKGGFVKQESFFYGRQDDARERREQAYLNRRAAAWQDQADLALTMKPFTELKVGSVAHEVAKAVIDHFSDTRIKPVEGKGRTVTVIMEIQVTLGMDPSNPPAKDTDEAIGFEAAKQALIAAGNSLYRHRS